MSKKALFNTAKQTVVALMRQYSNCGETKLPIARQLAESAKCSYATMRLVLAELEREGFIYQHQGSGIYLTDNAHNLIDTFLLKKLLYFRPPYFGTVDNSYNEWLAAGLETEATKRNWKMTTLIVNSHDEFLTSLTPLLPLYDAVTYAPVSDPFSLEQFAALRVLRNKPFVLYGAHSEVGAGVHSVSIDNRRGGAMAASILLSNNHRKIALLWGEPHGVINCHERAVGFSEMLELAGIQPVVIDAKVSRNANRFDCAYQAVSQALVNGLDVTAIFAISDYSAWGTLQALQDAGKHVPDDISLIGFDGLPFIDHLTPALTSIQQPLQVILERLFAIFQDESSSDKRRILIAPGYKSGASVAKITASPTLLQHPYQRLSDFVTY